MSVRWSPTTVPAVGPVETVRWASRAAMLFFERRGTAHLGFRSFQRIRRAFVTMASALGRASKRRVLRSGQDLSFTLSGGAELSLVSRLAIDGDNSLFSILSRRKFLKLVKKLVVGPWVGSTGPPRGVHRSARPFCRRCAPGLNWPGRASGAVTLKKLECSKQAYALDTLAWDNIIGFRRTTAKAFAKDVFINQERKLGARRRSDTVLVSTINDADQGSADVTFRTPLAPYEKSKSLGSGGSMVARLKLKGIDGRAPPGVEPAA
ncbi:hypothetical protein LWI29_032756 [Acer saccharum]|uniref:rRNA intron-encoded homing endonuclease n=1 Tax=Acer saccharum TaxID=4024 RepID=A0AA39SJU8_ACESA|nr:hypothetical protein LWI29_032756 [Acer saccharum]